MVQKTAVIYARVSTNDQDCTRQIKELEAFADRANYEIKGIFKETASGKKNDRPTRKKILNLAQRREIDTILVTELSRWGRSTQDLLETLNKLSAWNVSVTAMNGLTFELNTPHGQMMATILSGIAQFESDLLSERVKSGLALAKSKGKKLGRQQGYCPTVKRHKQNVLDLKIQGFSYRQIAKQLSISKTTVSKVILQNAKDLSNSQSSKRLK